MNCIIPGLNLKVLAKAIHALAKIGDELFIEANTEKLTLVTLNLRKTICIRYHFLESFFSNYEIDENAFNEQSKGITCKIHMKLLLPLLKGTHIEKKIEFMKLEYEANSDVIIFKMKYKCDDILMIHKLRLMDSESLTIDIKPDAGSNNILATSTFFNQLLTMFSATDDEITLELEKQKAVVRNYIVGGHMKPKSVRSQINLNASEFTMFQINNETSINFSLKPLRTAIHFAESFNMNVGINFESGGRPLVIIMKNPTFELHVMVATLNPYSDLHSSMATSSIPAKITQINQENSSNITIEDQQALLNINWDDCDMENEPTKNDKSKKSNFEKTVKYKKNNKDKNQIKGKNLCKKFDLPVDTFPMEVHDDVLPPSPESPKTKKAKLVFGRCFEPTFSETYLGKVLAPDSESE